MRGEAINDIQAAEALGEINGYLNCISLLKSLGQSPTITAEVEQTYGAEHADSWQ